MIDIHKIASMKPGEDFENLEPTISKETGRSPFVCMGLANSPEISLKCITLAKAAGWGTATPTWRLHQRGIAGEHHQTAQYMLANRQVSPEWDYADGSERKFCNAIINITELGHPFQIPRPLVPTSDCQKELFLRHHPVNSPKDDSWIGYDTKDVIKNVSMGWPDGASRMAEDVEALRKQLDSEYGDLKLAKVSRVKKFASRGEQLRSGVLNGSVPFEKAWRTSGSSLVKDSNVSIWVDLSAHCGIDPEEYRWRGVAMSYIIEKLEQSGYSVGVYGIKGTRDDSDDHRALALCYVKLKDPLMPTDLSRLAAVTYAPAWMRTFAFQYIASHGVHNVNSGLGRPISSENISNLMTHVIQPPKFHLIPQALSLETTADNVHQILSSFSELSLLGA